MAIDNVSCKCMVSDTMPYPKHDSRSGITVVFSFLPVLLVEYESYHFDNQSSWEALAM